MTVPLVLLSFAEYDLNLTMALLPFAGLAMLQQWRSREFFWLSTASLCGTAACLIAALVASGGLVRSLLSLALLLMPPAYFFLGRQIAKTGHTLAGIIRALAIFSAVFGIAIAGRLFLLGEPVVLLTPEGSITHLNARFLGLPIFGTYGILSVAALLCVQSFLCCGAMLAKDVRWVERVFFSVGLAALIYVVVASDRRSAQLGAICLFLFLIAYAVLLPTVRKWSVLGVAVFAVVLAVQFPAFLTRGSRLVDTVAVVVTSFTPAQKASSPVSPASAGNVSSLVPQAAAENASSPVPQAVLALSTGRDALILRGWQETMQSPIIGVGFGSFGRFSSEPVPLIVEINKSPHIYYLKVLWKGGVVFAIPFFIFLAYATAPLVSRLWKGGPEIAFAAGAVAFTLLVLNLTWDVLNVPSAGALVFFLLGLMAPAPALVPSRAIQWLSLIELRGEPTSQ